MREIVLGVKEHLEIKPENRIEAIRKLYRKSNFSLPNFLYIYLQAINFYLTKIRIHANRLDLDEKELGLPRIEVTGHDGPPVYWSDFTLLMDQLKTAITNEGIINSETIIAN